MKIDQDRYISTQRITHPSAILFTVIRGKSDDRVGLGIGFTTTTKARFEPGSLKAKTSASYVGNDE